MQSGRSAADGRLANSVRSGRKQPQRVSARVVVRSPTRKVQSAYSHATHAPRGTITSPGLLSPATFGSPPQLSDRLPMASRRRAKASRSGRVHRRLVSPDSGTRPSGACYQAEPRGADPGGATRDRKALMASG